jgi:hypothetical protein
MLNTCEPEEHRQAGTKRKILTGERDRIRERSGQIKADQKAQDRLSSRRARRAGAA